MKVSIIIPVLNEAEGIVPLLDSLAHYRTLGHEIIVVDGGSQDQTVQLATPLVTSCFTTQRGRALQMNAGARIATGDALLFLHADTCLPADALAELVKAFHRKKIWGFFRVKLDGNHWLFRVIEFMMNLRSCLTSIATGDQAIFVKQSAFAQAGTYPSQPLMEDISLSKQLRKLGRPACINDTVTVSSRRWQKNGIVRTILLMWILRLRYFMGASPDALVKKYYG